MTEPLMTPGGAEALVASLIVAPEGTRDGYERELFSHWSDLDGDGCDTRAEVLIAESRVPVQFEEGCRVVEGQWFSVYDGYFTADPRDLDIDHVVALSEAWDSGAATWAPRQREAFANDLDDPGSLIAVTAGTNRSKGDQDPAEWQPPNRAVWCTYATDWTRTKVRWALSADPTEVQALRNMLVGCP